MLIKTEHIFLCFSQNTPLKFYKKTAGFLLCPAELFFIYYL